VRIDPETIYLELQPSVCMLNGSTGETRYVPAVKLHFKVGRKWEKRVFAANENNGDTLGAILGRIGGWIDDAGGLDAAIRQATPITKAAA
jgi:hypothetical protein